MNHCIREHNKNLLFLVRDPVLTTVSATTAYAGKMLWDRALLFRFTNWLIGIWPAAWQSHKSGMKPCSMQLPEMWSTCHLCRGREWLGRMALLCLVLGWMKQCMQEEFWRDWCRVGWEGVSHGEDQLLITRSVQVVEQRSVFPVFSVRKWTRSLRACQQTQAPVCGRLRALPWDSCWLQGCASRSALPAQVRVHSSSQWVYHPHGSAQNTVWMMEITPLPGVSILRSLIPGRVACYSCRAEGMSRLCQQRRNLS